MIQVCINLKFDAATMTGTRVSLFQFVLLFCVNRWGQVLLIVKLRTVIVAP